MKKSLIKKTVAILQKEIMIVKYNEQKKSVFMLSYSKIITMGKPCHVISPLSS